MATARIPIYIASHSSVHGKLRDEGYRYPSDLEQLVTNIIMEGVSGKLQLMDAADLPELFSRGCQVDSWFKTYKEGDTIYLPNVRTTVGSQYESVVSDLTISHKGHFTSNIQHYETERAIRQVVSVTAEGTTVSGGMCALHVKAKMEELKETLSQITTSPVKRETNDSCRVMDDALDDLWDKFPGASGALMRVYKERAPECKPGEVKLIIRFYPKGHKMTGPWHLLPNFCTWNCEFGRAASARADLMIKEADIEDTYERAFWVSRELKNIGHYISRRTKTQMADSDQMKLVFKYRLFPFAYPLEQGPPGVFFEALMPPDEDDDSK